KGVGLAPISAGGISGLEPLRRSTEAEDDRADALAEVDDAVLVAPGACRDAPSQVRLVQELGGEGDLKPEVADFPQVLEALVHDIIGDTERGREGARHEGIGGAL